VQEAGHPQEIERTEEEEREAACEFCEIGENCDFTSPRKRLAEFEVAFTNPQFQRNTSLTITEDDVTG
jgi:exopolyphosphatase/pppGpp-phosphohydrolase